VKIKKIWIITLFPEYFEPLQKYGVLGSALRNERFDDDHKIEVHTLNPSDFNPKSFKGVDDAPFGGGVGMIMRPDVLRDTFVKGILEAGEYESKDDLHVVCPMPRGTKWCHDEAVRFAEDSLSFESGKDIVFICGRYEGIDERFLNNYVDEFISLGDFILTGGELAVMTILDSSMRFFPNVLGNKLSAVEESFASGSLEHALYTRPREFEGTLVPEAYLSGDPKKIDAEKENSSDAITESYRPDLKTDK